LPPLVLGVVRDRYLAGTANAEAQYPNAAGDEDTLTGSLGALISTPEPVRISIDGASEFLVRISYRKIRGRGQGAPEKRLGADGIFQVDVSFPGDGSVFRKGLPFQSKKNWRGRDSKLVEQARLMQETVGGGIVIDYTPRGFTACRTELVIEARGNRRVVDRWGNLRPLGQVLAHDFIDCSLGVRGLYYDEQNEAFLYELGEREISVVDTRISISEPRRAAQQDQR
jgi:hypothetical protein